jgi:CO/xanthine dehydrogenase Mo-binding subunit
MHRAVTHIGGPYNYHDVEVDGVAVFTNNPPAGAFRGFGVPQVAFALESALDALAARVGISPWEIRFLNAARPGDELPNGQLAGPDTALEECLLAVKPAWDAAGAAAGIACGFKNTGIGVGHFDVGRCLLRIGRGRVEVLTGAACIGQGLATVLTQIAADTLGLAPALVDVALPDTDRTPDSGTTTASRQTLITGEACRRACAAAGEALAGAAKALAEAARADEAADRVRGVARAKAAPSSVEDRAEGASAFPFAALEGREFPGEYVAETDPFDSANPNPVRHVAYSYACQVVVLGTDAKVDRVVAAHDSGLVVNPLAFEGQVEGGVVMGLGYALSEDFPLKDCVPVAKFGRLGLLRANEVPPVETIMIRKEGPGTAVDGGVSGAAYGAKGIGEISTIPTAAAAAGAYFALDGRLRTRLPLDGTPWKPLVPSGSKGA